MSSTEAMKLSAELEEKLFADVREEPHIVLRRVEREAEATEHRVFKDDRKRWNIRDLRRVARG